MSQGATPAKACKSLKELVSRPGLVPKLRDWNQLVRRECLALRITRSIVSISSASTFNDWPCALARRFADLHQLDAKCSLSPNEIPNALSAPSAASLIPRDASEPRLLSSPHRQQSDRSADEPRENRHECADTLYPLPNSLSTFPPFVTDGCS